MLVKVDTKNGVLDCRLLFKHGAPLTPEEAALPPKKRRRRSTSCWCFSIRSSKPEQLLIGFGVADCSSKDNFCRATGRRLALERALRDTVARFGIDDETFRAVLAGYERSLAGARVRSIVGNLVGNPSTQAVVVDGKSSS